MRLYSTAAALMVVLLSGKGIDAQKLRNVGVKDMTTVEVTAQGVSDVQMVPAATGKAAGDAGEKRLYRGEDGIMKHVIHALLSSSDALYIFSSFNAQVSTWAAGW